MTATWTHQRRNLSDVPEDDDGESHGWVDRWWYGERGHPAKGDPTVTVKAHSGGSGWVYMVEDGWNLVDMEQEFTRSDAVQNARNRVDLYRDKVE